MSSHSPSSDSKELEKQLRDLDPAPLDPSFLARLEEAADGTLVSLTPEEIRFEKSLRSHVPAALSPDFLKQLETIVADVPFAVDEKILLFPKTAPLVRKAAKSYRPMWAAAAAVALIGAATALFMPGNQPPQAVTGIVAPRGPVTSSPDLPAANSNFQAAGFNRGLGEVHDEGYTWDGDNNKPHRVVKVTYLDRITLKNKEGKIVEVEQPRVEYILVPEKVD